MFLPRHARALLIVLVLGAPLVFLRLALEARLAAPRTATGADAGAVLPPGRGPFLWSHALVGALLNAVAPAELGRVVVTGRAEGEAGGPPIPPRERWVAHERRAPGWHEISGPEALPAASTFP